jgi:hypothetical protein
VQVWLQQQGVTARWLTCCLLPLRHTSAALTPHCHPEPLATALLLLLLLLLLVHQPQLMQQQQEEPQGMPPQPAAAAGV